jgi:hypothetical protein
MQKKLLLVIAIYIFVISVDAQIKKGAVLLGGQIGFLTDKQVNNQGNPPVPDEKNTSFNFSPAFGKTVFMLITRKISGLFF